MLGRWEEEEVLMVRGGGVFSTNMYTGGYLGLGVQLLHHT